MKAYSTGYMPYSLCRAMRVGPRMALVTLIPR